jgi:hypothetical protein
MRKALRDLGAQWAVDPDRPAVAAPVLAEWEHLIAMWLADTSLPLLVRKFRDNRGQRLIGPGGRVVVPTDNSPAQWAFAVAAAGACPSTCVFRSMLITRFAPS